MASKYTPLWQYLQKQNQAEISLSYAKIEQILSFPIDYAFLTYKKEAREYGYEVKKISMKEKWVKFEKMK